MDNKTLEFLKSTEHRYHALGSLPNPKFDVLARKIADEVHKVSLDPVSPSGESRVVVDIVWVIMLFRQKIIDRDKAVNLLNALKAATDIPEFTGEDWLKTFLNGDEDTASSVNIGRTLQEPMSRIAIRKKLIELIDIAHDSLEEILKAAKDNADTIMVGHTHMSQAQPTTYGAYLVAIYDALSRSLSSVDLAYAHTNMCSAGCGALSGTGWPVDRYMVSDLLGFDELVEPTYDCEAAQDYTMDILFSIANMMLTITRTSMDHEIWGLEEMGYFTVCGDFLGPSSLMPQKAHPGGRMESIRIYANNAISEATKGMFALHGEPYQDILPIYNGWTSAWRAMSYAEGALTILGMYLPNMIIDKDRMLQLAEEGYSCMPDLVIKLVKEKGIGPRRAHRMCGTTVFLARKRKIKGNEITSELFNEALSLNGEEAMDITTEEIQEMLNPIKFIQRHNNVGDPNPQETLRLIELRFDRLENMRKSQRQRKDKLKAADIRVEQEMSDILG